MASLTRLFGAGLIGGLLLHPRETLFKAFNLGSLNAEDFIDCDGSATVTLDLRGTFNLTVEVAGTVDGTNWQLIPMRPINQASVAFVAAVAGTAAGTWVGQCAGYRRVRARVTAYTSGSASTTLAANTALYDSLLFGPQTNNTATAVGAAGAAVTLTLGAPGAGLRHHLMFYEIDHFATALLTAAAAPVTVTTTNIPGALALSFPADAAPQGRLFTKAREFPSALATSAQNTATTIVCPATTGVIWRVTAGFYVAP